MKDLNFPPRGDLEQTVFRYSEEVTEVGSSEVLGYYFVTLDLSWSKRTPTPTENFPSIITVTSLGILGADVTSPAATFQMKMEVEIDASQIPKAPMRITDWVEDGDLPPIAPPAPF